MFEFRVEGLAFDGQTAPTRTRRDRMEPCSFFSDGLGPGHRVSVLRQWTHPFHLSHGEASRLCHGGSL